MLHQPHAFDLANLVLWLRIEKDALSGHSKR
jgi:hypothetical protein